MGLLISHLAVPVLSSHSLAQTTELSLAAITAIGGPVQRDDTTIITSGGQGAAGFVRIQNTELGMGHIFALPKDFLPPRTTLVIGDPKFGSDPAVVTSATSFSFTSLDDLVIDGDELGFGVRETRFAIDDGSFQIFSSPFTLAAEGMHTIRFFSVDAADNAESGRTALVDVDNTHPLAAIQSPAEGAGLEQAVAGVVSVIGTANDLHFKEYRLEIAPGENTAEGFSLVVQSTTAIEGGLLGSLDTSGLGTGQFTIRLTAEDVVGHIAQTSVTIFVGEPGVDLLLGKTPGLNHPRGLAVSADGSFFWVADTNNDLLRAFDSRGGLFLTLKDLRYSDPPLVKEEAPPGKGGKGKGKEDKGNNPSSISGALKAFNKPAGLTLTSEGRLWVADSNNHRVLLISTAASDSGTANEGEVLIELGKKNPSGQTSPGDGDGEFHQPSDVVLDAGGNLYVADGLNHRLQKFDATGAFLAAIPLSSGTQPVGLAVEGTDRLLVADEANNRVIRISTSGILLAEIGLGTLTKPQGLFLGPSGRLFVADRNNDLVRVFDPSGGLQMSINGLNKPGDVSLDPLGRLLVADTNNGTIRRYSVDAATPTVVSLSKSDSIHAAAPVAASAVSGPDPAFRLSEVYAYPNPARQNQFPTMHVEVGLAGSVDIRIYDIGGDMVHQASLDASPKVVDDGQGPEYAYEYTWDTSSVASGVYIFVVHAHKPGEESLRKVTKLAILK